MKINYFISYDQKVFTNVSTNWTFGLIDANDNFYETRYIVSLDGQVLEQDLSKDVAANYKDRKIYEFPLKDEVNITKGEHTGSFKANFFQFGFEF